MSGSYRDQMQDLLHAFDGDVESVAGEMIALAEKIQGEVVPKLAQAAGGSEHYAITTMHTALANAVIELGRIAEGITSARPDVQSYSDGL